MLTCGTKRLVMLTHNEFGIAPGTYSNGNEIIVVTEILTHTISNGAVEQLKEPLVIFRGLMDVSKNKHGERYGVPITEFKVRYSKT